MRVAWKQNDCTCTYKRAHPKKGASVWSRVMAATKRGNYWHITGAVKANALVTPGNNNSIMVRVVAAAAVVGKLFHSVWFVP
jgi:hypothetical protein